jgi:hypothetical protein
VKLTELEAKLLRNIALNDYQPLNGGEPKLFSQTSAVWSNCLDCGPETIAKKSIPGIVASLVKKGLVWTMDAGTDSTIALTEAGFNAYKAL